MTTQPAPTIKTLLQRSNSQEDTGRASSLRLRSS